MRTENIQTSINLLRSPLILTNAKKHVSRRSTATSFLKTRSTRNVTTMSLMVKS